MSIIYNQHWSKGTQNPVPFWYSPSGQTQPTTQTSAQSMAGRRPQWRGPHGDAHEDSIKLFGHIDLPKLENYFKDFITSCICNLLEGYALLVITMTKKIQNKCKKFMFIWII